jgi:2-oxoisovalerate dehydrogenase E1 component beta subunit
VEVIDLRTLAPMDTDTFLESVAKTSRAVIVHEDNRTLGIGAEVAATIAEQAFDCLDAPILRVTAPDVPLLPAAAELENFCTVSADKIVAALERSMAY